MADKRTYYWFRKRDRDVVSYGSKLISQSLLERSALESESLVDKINMNTLKRVVHPRLDV